MWITSSWWASTVEELGSWTLHYDHCHYCLLGHSCLHAAALWSVALAVFILYFRYHALSILVLIGGPIVAENDTKPDLKTFGLPGIFSSAWLRSHFPGVHLSQEESKSVGSLWFMEMPYFMLLSVYVFDVKLTLMLMPMQYVEKNITMDCTSLQ
jgi:hypothetical protein